jgi:hypothetical protein
MTLSADLAARCADFWARVLSDEDEETGDDCWYWKLACDRDGYGKFLHAGNKILAHRVAWMLHHKRDIPPGMVVMHECDTPRCCKPAHLKLGTQQENIADRVAKGRSAFGRTARFTTKYCTARLWDPRTDPPIATPEDWVRLEAEWAAEAAAQPLGS